jgi:hypothetical protein
MKIVMSIRMKLGFRCHLLAMLLLGGTGLLYLFRSQFMPHHAIALGKTWTEIDPAFQILLLALIRIVGGAWIATALAIGIVLFIPFRQGMRWARWAVPAIGLVTLLPAFYAMLSVTLNTPATAPWKSALLTIVMLVAGFVLSLEPEKKTDHIEEKSGA